MYITTGLGITLMVLMLCHLFDLKINMLAIAAILLTGFTLSVTISVNMVHTKTVASLRYYKKMLLYCDVTMCDKDTVKGYLKAEKRLYEIENGLFGFMIDSYKENDDVDPQ